MDAEMTTKVTDVSKHVSPGRAGRFSDVGDGKLSKGHKSQKGDIIVVCWVSEDSCAGGFTIVRKTAQPLVFEKLLTIEGNSYPLNADDEDEEEDEEEEDEDEEVAADANGKEKEKKKAEISPKKALRDWFENGKRRDHYSPCKDERIVRIVSLYDYE